MSRQIKYFLLFASAFTAMYVIQFFRRTSQARFQVRNASRVKFLAFNTEKFSEIHETTSVPSEKSSKALSIETTVSSPLTTDSVVERFVVDTDPQCAPNDVCIGSKTFKWRLFIFVKSAAHHTMRRTHIRSTWGSVKYVDGGQFSTFFVVGKTKDTKQQALIDEEFDRYGDILQADIMDDYLHVVYLTLKGMQWATEHLNSSDYYSSCDDDMMVNLGKLQESIENYIGEAINKSWPEFPLICSYELVTGWTPVRDKRNKNYISLEEYKWTEWPNFCLGGMYTANVNVVRQLYEVSKTMEPLRTDDVWITGILRNIIGMPKSMIVFPKPAIAQHISPNGGYFQNQWSKTYKQFETKSLCKC